MTSSRRDFLQCLGAGVAAACASLLRAQVKLDGPDVATAIEHLKAGQFLWAPAVAPAGPVLIVVSLPLQRAYVYRNGVLIGVTTVSTGTKGHETPTGVFTVLQKRVKHASNLYNAAPMPYMQRLTWTGIAMHAGHLPGYPASHGCIRMPMDFARQLYTVTKLGMTVVITDLETVPRVAPTPELLEETATGPSAPSTPTLWTWNAAAAPTGPVSLILSGADKRLVVLRNGVKIGSAAVEIHEPITQTRAFTLAKIDASGFQWMELPLPGQSWKGTRMLSADERARLKIPEDFRSLLDTVLTPGVTVVVTADSLATAATGVPVTVMESMAGESSGAGSR